MLGSLARLGWLFREALLDKAGVRDDLIRAKRIQIIAANDDEPVLPLEFCYDGPAPDLGAQVCPKGATALADGKCDPSCPTGKARSTIICPLAFWGTSRVIERHAYSKAVAETLVGRNFALQTEQTDGRRRLRVTSGSVCAAAENARAVNGTAVDQAFARAARIATPGGEVTTWAEWQKAVKSKPKLLVLLPHTQEDDDGVRMMSIAANQNTYISSIDESYVGAERSGGPVVLLLGCSTAPALRAFQSFVARFQKVGASIVVGTLCEILGQHAAPIAENILKELATVTKARDGLPLGDVMVRIRRKLLANGYPIVMAVTAYGDADWRL
jgi:hypothetical protein